jgi:L-fuconolactonase
MKSISIIDSHVHFWDPSKLKYDWIESAGALNHPFLLTDYHKATEGIEVDKMVFVECNCQPGSNEEEVKWVQDLAKSDERIQAIVAYADLTEVNNLDHKLKNLAAYKMVKGIRHNIQFNEPGFALQPTFIEGVKKVLDLDMHFELCITHDQLVECIELVSALPERLLILNHCGKPGIKDGEIDNWKTNMKQLAQYEHVYCKVSGLFTEADLKNGKREDIIPYTDHVLKCFGNRRIVYGSDWPVCTLAGGYHDWYNFVSEWTSDWSEQEKINFYHENAKQFYRL